jgi:hypothetical protein
MSSVIASVVAWGIGLCVFYSNCLVCRFMSRPQKVRRTAPNRQERRLSGGSIPQHVEEDLRIHLGRKNPNRDSEVGLPISMGMVLRCYSSEVRDGKMCACVIITADYFDS